jgi:hypothetical protein
VREKGSFAGQGSGGSNVWHYENTCRVTLTRDDLPEYSASADKSHFLMVNSGRVEDPLPMDPSIPRSVPSSVEIDGATYKIGRVGKTEDRAGQKILAGTFDRYSSSLNTPLALPEGNVDGTYTLRVEVDPTDNAAELDETNNVELFQLKIENGVVVSIDHVPSATPTA